MENEYGAIHTGIVIDYKETNIKKIIERYLVKGKKVCTIHKVKRYFLYHGQIEGIAISGRGVIKRPFADCKNRTIEGYENLEDVMKSLTEEYTYFGGGGNLVEIFIADRIDAEMREDLESSIRGVLGDIEIKSARLCFASQLASL